jgi:serine/threonine protein kinase
MLDTKNLQGKKLIAPDRGNKEAILEDEIGRGGEGVICNIKDYPKAVAKIYYEDKRDKDREKKLELIINKFKSIKPPVFINELAVPITRLYYESEFVGYVMRKVDGRALKIVLAGDKKLKAFYKDVKRIDLVELCIDFLKKVDFLHSLNILIGDINLNNILVDKNDFKKCYIVDLDAAQVDNMPCPVGTDEFTPPNLQGKNFKNTLRTKEDEYFSISVVLFMILMLGKHPFSRQDGGSPGENIKNHKFPYPVFGFKELHQNAPRGYYKNIWTHFPKELREKFYETFANDKRFTPKEWIEVLEKYLICINNGKCTNELAPLSFKAYKIPIKVTCENCKEKFEIEKSYYDYLKKNKMKILCNKCYDLIYGINQAKKSFDKKYHTKSATKKNNKNTYTKKTTYSYNTTTTTAKNTTFIKNKKQSNKWPFLIGIIIIGILSCFFSPGAVLVIIAVIFILSNI